MTIPYVRGVSAAVERTLRRPGISTTVRPYKTLRQCLVYPKDKRTVQESAEVVYFIRCKDYPMVYMGEMGRRFAVRQKEHKKDLKQLEGVSIPGLEGRSLSQRSTSQH